MQLTIKAHFNKMTKDSKKELVQFYIKGDDEKRQELNVLCREIVELNIDKIDSLTAEFVKKSQDSKKTVLDFIIKGGTSTEHSNLFYSIAGTDVELTISESQMSIEEFKGEEEMSEYEEDDNQKRLEYEVNSDGTAELKANEETDSPDPMAGAGNTPSGRQRPLTKKEKEAATNAAANENLGV